MTISQLKSKLIISLLNIILLLVLTANVRANEYYVAKNGNDNNSGSEANPWLTIQKAASMAHAGDTVYIKNGTYTELVTIQNSGNSGSYIAFKQYPGHKAIIDGTGNAGWWGVISIQGKSYIKLDGFEIRNNSTGWGVLVEGSSRSEVSNIELVNLNVHHTGGEAIQIRGNTNSAHHVTITNCTVHDGTGGASGIDVYMYNGGRPHHVVVGGCTAYNFPSFAGISSEQADNIVIENNVSYGNAYGLDIGSGANNVVRYNTVYNCSDLGIAISSNQDSLIYNNTIHDISGDGVALYSYYWSAHGEAHARNEYYNNVSYSVNCGVFESNYKQPSGGAGTSTRHKYYNNVFSNVGPCFKTPFWFHGTTYLEFYNNTIYMNPNNNAIKFESGATYADVENNIISISGAYSPIIVDTSSQTGSVIDYNCYHNRTGSVTGPGVHSVTGDPKFVDSANKIFRLKTGSPCIDAGSSNGNVPLTDIEGYSRCDDPSTANTGGGLNPYYDIGAYEYPCMKRPNPPQNLRIE